MGKDPEAAIIVQQEQTSRESYFTHLISMTLRFRDPRTLAYIEHSRKHLTKDRLLN
jgi:hypothetical protein